MTRKALILAVVLGLLGSFFCGPVQAEPAFSFPTDYSPFWVGFDFNTGQTDDNMTGFTGILAPSSAASWNISATDAATGVTLSILNGQQASADGDRGTCDRVTNSAADTTNFNNNVAANDSYRNMYRDFIFNKINLNDASGYDNSIRLNLDNLTPGQEYLVRLYSYDAAANNNTFAGVFSGTDTGAYIIDNASLLATYRNLNANASAAYIDVAQTANASGQIDLVMGMITPGGTTGFTFFNGMEIIEKPAMSPLMKVDIRLAGNTTVEKTFQPLYFTNSTATQSQTFYSDSGIEVTVDSNDGDARARQRGTYKFPASVPMKDLYQGMIHPNGGVVNVGLTGLTPGQLYEMVIYSADPDSNDGAYSSWYVVDGATETMFKTLQFNRHGSQSADSHYFTITFEAEAADMYLRGKTGSGVVVLNGFELHELVAAPAAGAPTTIARVDINSEYNSNSTTSQGVSNRPIAGRFEELLMTVGTSEATMTTSSGLTVTVNTGADNNGRHRTSSNLGHNMTQQYYNENNLDVSMALMQDFAFSSGTNALTLDLDGLIAGHKYELTIYSQDLDMNSGHTNWYLGDVPANLDDDIWFVSYFGDEAASQAAANDVDVTDYWSYTNTFIAESDLLRISGIGAGGASAFAFLNGFALTDLGASGGGAVPEPATWVMLLLGAGMGVLAVRRKKS